MVQSKETKLLIIAIESDKRKDTKNNTTIKIRAKMNQVT